MGYLLFIISLCTLFYLIRYMRLKEQVKSIIDQLKASDEQKVTLQLNNRLIEDLAGEINRIKHREIEEKANKLRLDRELKQAIAGMSHDLRTPLTAIIGYIELIEKSSQLKGKEEHYLRVAKKRAIHLQQLIHNFFALSTVDTDDYPMKLKRVRINSILKETAMSYYDQFKKANKELMMHISKENLMIVSDSNALKRVLENLFLNALQHSTADLQIDLRRQEEKVVLTMRNKMDEGITLDKEQLFERFFTTDQTRQASRGLGLSIVKSLMEKMNGEIFVILEDGEFNITCRWPVSSG